MKNKIYIAICMVLILFAISWATTIKDSMTYTKAITIQTGSPIVLEGATKDAYQTTIAVTDPTADRTITLPNLTGTVGVILGIGADVAIPSTLATNGVDVANSVWGASNVLVFEGATANDFETTFSPTDATADRTITLPDEAGTLAYTGTKLTAGSGTGVTVALSQKLVTQIYKVTVDYTQFDAAATNHDLTIATMPAKTIIHAAIGDVTTAFVCASVCTTATLAATLGISAGGVELLESFDIDAAAATFGDTDTEVGSKLDIAAATNSGYVHWTGSALVMRGVSGTGNWGDGAGATNLNAGSITFYILYSILP